MATVTKMALCIALTPKAIPTRQVKQPITNDVLFFIHDRYPNTMLKALTNMIPVRNTHLHPRYGTNFPISGEPRSCVVHPNHYAIDNHNAEGHHIPNNHSGSVYLLYD